MNLIAALNSISGPSGEIYLDDDVFTVVNNILNLENIMILGIEMQLYNVKFTSGNYMWNWNNNSHFVTGFGAGSASNDPWTLSWQ